MTMKPELEIYLTTSDGVQHLRLHGWLKRNNILIKSETISKTNDQFGLFMVYMINDMLDILKEANLEQGMYCDLEVVSDEDSRLSTYKRQNPINFDWDEEKINEEINEELNEDSNFPRNEKGLDMDSLEDIDNYSSSIKSFMFSLDLQSPEDIDNFIKQANETSLKLFKREDEFTEEYIQTNALSTKEKIRDIEIMIEYFIENGERYEDCALLQKISKRIMNYEINNLYKLTN